MHPGEQMVERLPKWKIGSSREMFPSDLTRNTTVIAVVIDMFRLECGGDSRKSPLPPFFERGNAYTPAFLLVARSVLKSLQDIASPPFDKGGQGDFKKHHLE